MNKAIALSIVLLALSVVPTSARGQRGLSAQDSTDIALIIADRVAPMLRSINGADSTNAVCVRIEAGSSAQSLIQTVDSALRAKTGGALVAPVSISPLRAIVIDSVAGTGDIARVRWRTKGGDLVRGGMAWTHSFQWLLVRHDSAWTVESFGGIIGDGYIRADLPKPPIVPECLPRSAG
jgi:hypothetical protein